MHEGQFALEARNVVAILADQRPDLATADVRPVASWGTVNALFRIGDAFVARFPLVPSADDARRHDIEDEMRHARTVGAHVSVRVPRPIGLGSPHARYGGWWSLWSWVDGEIAGPDTVGDLERFAHDLARFVQEVRAMPAGADPWVAAHRGGRPLAASDAWVRSSIERGRHLVDASAVTAAWDTCLRTPAHGGPPVPVHADLIPANLIVQGGRLVAVIDHGPRHAGDPASDLTPAWHLFDRASRQTWRALLSPDDDAWRRGRGWALEQAIGALHYYEHTNPGMLAMARRTLREVLEDAETEP